MSNIRHSPNTMSVKGVDNTKYIHRLRDTCPFTSDKHGLAWAKTTVCGGRHFSSVREPQNYVPLLKSKNGMLKIDDMKVPGRKNDPIIVNVFIDALSRPLLFTKRFC